MSGTCALIRKRDVAVEAILPSVPTEVRDSFDPDRDKRGFRADGDNETLANGTNMPNCGGQSKYLKELLNFSDTVLSLNDVDVINILDTINAPIVLSTWFI